MSQSWDSFLDDNETETGSTDASSLSIHPNSNADDQILPNNSNIPDANKTNGDQLVDQQLNSAPIPNPMSDFASDDFPTRNPKIRNSPPMNRPFYYPGQIQVNPNKPNEQMANPIPQHFYTSYQKQFSPRPELPRFQTPPPAQKTQRILSGKGKSDGIYYYVQFHPNRLSYAKNPNKLDIEINDYVITEVDRGIDLGRIIRIDSSPPEKDITSCPNIIRKATRQEIQMIPAKEQKEIDAKKVCQEKANELGLPMTVTGTEFQFDGKKLTVYYTAGQYIDFRNLVHTLFKVFGTRIWMVWFDGTSPVRDVFTHHTRDRRFTLE